MHSRHQAVFLLSRSVKPFPGTAFEHRNNLRMPTETSHQQDPDAPIEWITPEDNIWLGRPHPRDPKVWPSPEQALASAKSLC